MDAILDVIQGSLAIAYAVSSSLDPSRSKEGWIDMVREGLSDSSISLKGLDKLRNGVRKFLAARESEREIDKEIASEEEMQKQLISEHGQLFEEAHNAVQEGTDKTSHAERVQTSKSQGTGRNH